jgi:hypothetical protein
MQRHAVFVAPHSIALGQLIIKSSRSASDLQVTASRAHQSVHSTCNSPSVEKKHLVTFDTHWFQFIRSIEEVCASNYARSLYGCVKIATMLDHRAPVSLRLSALRIKKTLIARSAGSQKN